MTIYSELLTIPKNILVSKEMLSPLKIKGTPLELVNKRALGTEGLSLIKVSKFADVTSITFDYKYLAAALVIFFTSSSPS